MQHLLMLYDAVVVWPGSRYNVVSGRGIRTSSIFNSQHAATRRNRMAKRAQHIAPNTLFWYVALKMLRSFGAFKCWAKDVATCCDDMLRLFDRGFMKRCPRECFHSEGKFPFPDFRGKSFEWNRQVYLPLNLVYIWISKTFLMGVNKLFLSLTRGQKKMQQ